MRLELGRSPSARPRVEHCALSRHTTVVTLHGDHDASTRTRLLDVLDRAATVPNVIVDLTPCTFADSATIGALLRAFRDVPPGRSASVVVPDGDGEVARAVGLLGVGELLPLVPTVGEALRRAGEAQALGREP
jgi:anti-anti-sigma factor